VGFCFRLRILYTFTEDFFRLWDFFCFEFSSPLFAASPTMPINQPSNQIKFTNVSVVRLKKGIKRLNHLCSGSVCYSLLFYYRKEAL
jgi:hypothetical protein